MGRESHGLDLHVWPATAFSFAGSLTAMESAPPSLGWAPATETETGVETVRFNLARRLHWIPRAAICFVRRLNNTPATAAALLVIAGGTIKTQNPARADSSYQFS